MQWTFVRLVLLLELKLNASCYSIAHRYFKSHNWEWLMSFEIPVNLSTHRFVNNDSLRAKWSRLNTSRVGIKRLSPKKIQPCVCTASDLLWVLAFVGLSVTELDLPIANKLVTEYLEKWNLDVWNFWTFTCSCNKRLYVFKCVLGQSQRGWNECLVSISVLCKQTPIL